MSQGRKKFIDDLEFDVKLMFSELQEMKRHSSTRDGEHLASLDLYISRLCDTMQRAVKVP